MWFSDHHSGQVELPATLKNLDSLLRNTCDADDRCVPMVLLFFTNSFVHTHFISSRILLSNQDFDSGHSIVHVFMLLMFVEVIFVINSVGGWFVHMVKYCIW